GNRSPGLPLLAKEGVRGRSTWGEANFRRSTGVRRERQMRIVICVKQVLDPDAVDNYVLVGKLEIGPDGKTLTQTSIPRLMNGYDEQAIECALRLRDAWVDCKIHVVSVGTDPTKILQQAVAMGADEIATIPVDTGAVDGYATA